MADNTIDSLEIKIESSADQAVRSLENLSAKLTTIKNTLGNDVDILRSISSIINKNDGKTDNNTTVDKNIIEYISWEIEDSTMSIIDLVEKAEHLNNEFFNKYHLGTVPEDSVDKEKAVMFYYMKDGLMGRQM